MLINRLATMLGKSFSAVRVLFIPTASMENAEKAAGVTERLRDELLQMGLMYGNITVHDMNRA